MYLHSQAVLQDPYIKLTLHDGRFDEGGKHRGESVKTKTKDNAGGNATYNETFQINKPGLRRFVLFLDKLALTVQLLKESKITNLCAENMDNLRVELWDSDTLSDDIKGRWFTR